MSRTICIRWFEPETDLEFSVRCRVYPGRPMRGPSLDGPGEPEEPPEVEILSVRDDKRQDRPDMVDLLASDFMDDIEEAALSEYVEAERDAEEARAEYEEDARRERYYELRGVMGDVLGRRLA